MVGRKARRYVGPLPQRGFHLWTDWSNNVGLFRFMTSLWKSEGRSRGHRYDRTRWLPVGENIANSCHQGLWRTLSIVGYI
jgi:hypothetical protein